MLYPAATLAQSAGDPVSQAVVQPLPPAGVSDLNTALRRLARNSRDVDALVDAGTASLNLSDIDAAIGFFGRAAELSPTNPRIKVGLAAAYTRQQRPLDALQLFDDAERAGASTDMLASDRGLAYDLVGDNVSARRHYETALSRRENAETRQRLALSHAIAGDRAAFERVLAPLIAQADAGSYRTRAFGLAILGDEDEAVAITEAVMPRNLSAQIAPYLRYMPRLTRAQQAAAANLGTFPKAAQIGRDSPQIAQYTGSTVPSSPSGADARLAPQGEPLGRREEVASAEPQPQVQPQPQPRTEPVRVAAAPRPERGTATRSARTMISSTSRIARPPRPSRAETIAPSGASEPVRTAAAEQAPTTATIPVTITTVPNVAVLNGVRSENGELPASGAASETAAATESLAATASVQPEPVAVPDLVRVAEVSPSAIPAPGPGFDLATVSGSAVTTPATETAPDTTAIVALTPPPSNVAPAGAVVSQPVVQEAPESVAAAFASFSLTPRAGVPVSSDVVDIRAIEPPREVAKEVEPKPEAKPALPANPKRYWVQIATGRDSKALPFDWRRISRQAPDILGDKSGFIAAWNDSNRLLAGPFGSAREANNAVTALKGEGVDSFTYTSPEGEEITKIP